MRYIFAICTFACLVVACSPADLDSLSVTIEKADRELTVSARGEVLASDSTSVDLPVGTNMPLYIKWLIPEFSAVEKGDLVALFDDMELKSNWRQHDSQIANLSYVVANLSRDSQLGRAQIQHQQVRVEGEAEIAQTFADFDPRYFSRIEIIDAIGDLNFLRTEAGYYLWQEETHDQRSVAQSQQSTSQLTARERERDVYEDALNIIELRSPAVGTFVYAKTPWGRKLSRGSPVFPGSKVGLIPIRNKVKARIFVPKGESEGIEVGQKVRLKLDGLADQEIDAVVSTVAPMASVRTREDPRKYIMVEATIDDDDVENIRVGTALSATIVLANLVDSFVLPSQSVFVENERAQVYLIDGSEMQKREVEIGVRSPTVVEVTSGLQSGDQVSLIVPESLDSASDLAS